MLHTSTASSGGAALAAQRLVAAEQAMGLDVSFMSQSDSHVTLDGGPLRSIAVAQRLNQKSRTAFNRAITKDMRYFFSPVDSPILSSADLRRWSPDIVHVHNWYNFFSWDSLAELQRNGIPVVATAHDERIMTGGCHTTLGCDEFLRGCRKCPQSRLPGIARRPARDLFAQVGAHPIDIVAPSQWLTDRMQERYARTHTRVHRIPNCLDAEVFRPLPRSGPAAIGVMLGKASDLVSDVLGQLIRKLAQRGQDFPLLRVAGAGARPEWPGKMDDVGYLTTEHARAQFWQAVDIAFVPTWADNFPNTSLEAIFSGAIPVTSRVGGAGEAIDQMGVGAAVEPNASSLAEALCIQLRVVNQSRESAEDRWTIARRIYGQDVIARQYARLYGEVLSRKGP